MHSDGSIYANASVVDYLYSIKVLHTDNDEPQRTRNHHSQCKASLTEFKLVSSFRVSLVLLLLMTGQGREIGSYLPSYINNEVPAELLKSLVEVGAPIKLGGAALGYGDQLNFRQRNNRP